MKWKTFQGLICSFSSRRRNDDESQSSDCIAAAVAITIIVILIFNSPETRNLKLNTMYLIVNAWFHKKLICNMPKTYLPSKQKSFFMLKYKAQCVKDPWCSKGLKIQIEIGTIEGLYWKTYTPIIVQANPLKFL